MISRRGFLDLLASAVAASVLDPGELLHIPGVKKIFIPTSIVRPSHMAWARITNGEFDDDMSWAAPRSRTLLAGGLSDEQSSTLLRSASHRLLQINYDHVPIIGEKVYAEKMNGWIAFTTIPQMGVELAGEVCAA